MTSQFNANSHSAPVAAPLYGEAAAIYEMYQRTFLERDREPPRPRKPRRGLLARLAAAVSSQLRAPAYAQ